MGNEKKNKSSVSKPSNPGRGNSGNKSHGTTKPASPKSSSSTGNTGKALARKPSAKGKSLLAWSTIEERVMAYHAEECPSYNPKLSPNAVKCALACEVFLQALCKQYDKSKKPSKVKIKQELAKVLPALVHITRSLPRTDQPTEGKGLVGGPPQSLQWSIVLQKVKQFDGETCKVGTMTVASTALQDVGQLEKTFKQICSQYENSKDSSKKEVKQRLGNFVPAVLHIVKVGHQIKPELSVSSEEEEVNIVDSSGRPAVPGPSSKPKPGDHPVDNKNIVVGASQPEGKGTPKTVPPDCKARSQGSLSGSNANSQASLPDQKEKAEASPIGIKDAVVSPGPLYSKGTLEAPLDDRNKTGQGSIIVSTQNGKITDKEGLNIDERDKSSLSIPQRSDPDEFDGKGKNSFEKEKRLHDKEKELQHKEENLENRERRLKDLESRRPRDGAKKETKSEKTLQKELQSTLEKFDQAVNNSRRLEQEVHKLRKLNDDLRDRLSTEMCAKVSADESSVENISIQSRPMKIADSYHQFQCEKWFDAKECLDKHLPKINLSESLSLLCNMLKMTEEIVTETFNRHYNALSQALLEPTEFAVAYLQVNKLDESVSTTTNHRSMTESRYKKVRSSKAENIHSNATASLPRARKGYMNLPVTLSNAIGDFLRIHVDKCDYKQLIKFTTEEIRKRFAAVEPVMNKEPIVSYIEAMVKLCWTMVIQRPPMTFDFHEIRREDTYQDLYWGSEECDDAQVCLVYPILLQGAKPMGKGKAYLYKPEKRHVQNIKLGASTQL